ncbi:class I SAM-dependent methyltransferase [Mangrovibacterium sp.]|uniref:class I SAM-dependent methyltransferase n=1 Tax=Mangrovibacterium sp. TaxID=1961364 RepID=UPI00356B112A
MGQEKFYSSIASYYEHIFPLNKQQVGFIQSEFESLEDVSFIDIGCSIGQLANELCKHGALGVAIDLNPDMIRRAVEMYGSAFLSFREMDMLTLQSYFAPQYFDAVICFGNTLVHLDSIAQVSSFFRQCFDSLKPGGKFLGQILNYRYVLDNRVTSLAIIENEFVRFDRHYRLPDKDSPKIDFRTRLTVKSSGLELDNSTNLIPLQKNELEKLLLLSGFSSVHFYDGFNKTPYTGRGLPLVFAAYA